MYRDIAIAVRERHGALFRVMDVSPKLMDKCAKISSSHSLDGELSVIVESNARKISTCTEANSKTLSF